MSEEEAQIQVRGMNGADWRGLYEIQTDRRVCWGTLQVPFQSEDEVRKKVENPPEGLHRLVAEVDGHVVGATSLQRFRSPRKRHAADCGIIVHPDYWNRGVGSALMAALLDLADNWLDLKRVELEVFTDNAAAVHLYEKFGFVIEGTKRSTPSARGSTSIPT